MQVSYDLDLMESHLEVQGNCSWVETLRISQLEPD